MKSAREKEKKLKKQKGVRETKKVPIKVLTISKSARESKKLYVKKGKKVCLKKTPKKAENTFHVHFRVSPRKKKHFVDCPKDYDIGLPFPPTPNHLIINQHVEKST